MVARIFDGISDIFFGSLIDKTHTKMGKARPWMFWATLAAALIIAIFAISSLGDFAMYAWFFITYVLLNAVFFTANNIAFSTLTAITKNAEERVQMGSIRFVFTFGTSTPDPGVHGWPGGSVWRGCGRVAQCRHHRRSWA